jgi:flagellar hook-associated protein 1 FlgK
VSAAGIVTSTTPSPGANDVALAIAALRGGGADQAYSTLVSRIGNDVREVLRGETNADALVQAVQDRRDSTSGVSLDEEMTGLVRFQRAYQASARAMSTLDEALDVLINRTGRVGL